MVKAAEARSYRGSSPSEVGGLASGHYCLWCAGALLSAKCHCFVQNRHESLIILN